MEKKEFEFKKVDGKFAFIMHSPDIERTEVVTESFAKEHYADLIKQKEEQYANLGALNRQIEKFKVEKDDELEHFIELANKAANYKKYMDTQANHKATLDMIEMIEESMRKVEAVMPEWKRAKK
jgi:hypothetical protein